jgi:hypothetical protein
MKSKHESKNGMIASAGQQLSLMLSSFRDNHAGFQDNVRRFQSWLQSGTKGKQQEFMLS